jgi:hypothetical protein
LLNTSGMCACNDWQFYDPHPLIADVIISSFMTGGYVEKRWISSRIRIYPITIWCVFRQAIRINNDIEGYHNDLNTQAVIVNPP